MASFLNPDLSYDRRAIMTEAVRVARLEAAAWLRQFGDVMSWKAAMAFGLRRVWDNARTTRRVRMKEAAAAAERAATAALSDREREIARLRRELFAAEHVDNTKACFAAKASITARLHQLGA